MAKVGNIDMLEHVPSKTLHINGLFICRTIIQKTRRGRKCQNVQLPDRFLIVSAKNFSGMVLPVFFNIAKS